MKEKYTAELHSGDMPLDQALDLLAEHIVEYGFQTGFLQKPSNKNSTDDNETTDLPPAA